MTWHHIFITCRNPFLDKPRSRAHRLNIINSYFFIQRLGWTHLIILLWLCLQEPKELEFWVDLKNLITYKFLSGIVHVPGAGFAQSKIMYYFQYSRQKCMEWKVKKLTRNSNELADASIIKTTFWYFVYFYFPKGRILDTFLILKILSRLCPPFGWFISFYNGFMNIILLVF